LAVENSAALSNNTETLDEYRKYIEKMLLLSVDSSRSIVVSQQLRIPSLYCVACESDMNCVMV
jgi:hypothetical protein